MDRKRGQITVFLILGVVLVFIVVAVILLSVTIQKTTLERKHQEIAQRLLQKEALRIYVDEELPDIIDDFLINFGKQGGKVYQDQGGLEPFVEEDVLDDESNIIQQKNGLRYPLGTEELKVAYGISYESPGNDNGENVYPCSIGSSLPCRYQYPQRRAGGDIVRFGTPELPRISVVEQQLARYLGDRLITFIQDFIERKIRLDVQVIRSSEPPDIDVFFESDRLRVAVKYPLILRYQGEDIAALADFSFTKETQFKRHYDAIRELFQLDNEFLDFELTAEQLTLNTFEYNVNYQRDDNVPTYCQLNDDGLHHCIRNLKFAAVKNMVEFTRVDDVEINDIISGDDIFIFRLPPGTILRDQEYTFVMARQNRPPVLDYITRDVPDGYVVVDQAYDYVVVPGLESSKNIDSSFNVRDPDGDNSELVLEDNAPHNLHFVNLPANGPQVVSNDIPQLNDGGFSFRIISTENNHCDGFCLEDSQIVKVVEGFSLTCLDDRARCATQDDGGVFVRGECQAEEGGRFICDIAESDGAGDS